MASCDRSAVTAATSLVAAVCALTFVHFAAAQMRSPLVPLYAAAHGVTATGVGFIVAAHMAVAAVASIPLGRASDVWGRRMLLLGGMATSAVTSLLLPTVESTVGLAVMYGLAGLGVAAFTPSAMSLVGDAAPPGAAGRAYAWYATAHYGAIGIGPFLAESPPSGGATRKRSWPARPALRSHSLWGVRYPYLRPVRPPRHPSASVTCEAIRVSGQGGSSPRAVFSPRA
jgi:MFS family permease